MHLPGFAILFGILFFGGELSTQPSHDSWTIELHKFVDENGFVDYQSWRNDRDGLTKYLASLQAYPPQSSWSRSEITAYWINAYNAYTIALILQHYPVRSIKDIGGKIPKINSVWDINFIPWNGQTINLNEIEHSILRKKYPDPRIHACLVCASYSCPMLRREAFVARDLDAQMDDACLKFLKDPNRNQYEPSGSSLSMIFKWYASDFGGNVGVKKFIKKYVPEAFPHPKTKMKYLDYNWALNDSKIFKQP